MPQGKKKSSKRRSKKKSPSKSEDVKKSPSKSEDELTPMELVAKYLPEIQAKSLWKTISPSTDGLKSKCLCTLCIDPSTEDVHFVFPRF